MADEQVHPTVVEVGDDADVLRIVRRILPWVLLVLVLLRVIAIVADYRSQTAPKTSSTASSSAAKPAGKPAAKAPKPATSSATPSGTASAPATSSATPTATVVVLVDGVNFRTAPSNTSSVIEALPKDATLTWLGDQSGWYHVRDAQGREGYITMSTSYVRKQ